MNVLRNMSWRAYSSVSVVMISGLQCSRYEHWLWVSYLVAVIRDLLLPRVEMKGKYCRRVYIGMLQTDMSRTWRTLPCHTLKTKNSFPSPEPLTVLTHLLQNYFLPLGTVGCFSGGKVAGGVKLTTHLHLAPSLRIHGVYLHSYIRFHRVPC